MPAVKDAPVEATKPKPYRMPVASLGERVLFFTDADLAADPQYGTVVESGPVSCTVRIMLRHGADLTKYDVPHKSDPRLVNSEIRKNGAWDYHPDTLALRDLAARVTQLEELAT